MSVRVLAPPVLLLGALAGVPTPAHAADAAVEVAGFEFTPATVRVALGERVTWTFTDQTSHTSTSDEGFWDSGPKNDGQTYARTFVSAGTFAYACTPHPHMRGRVRVPLQAAGSPADGWRLRWATGAAPADRDYDVQVRRPGADRWTWWRRNTGKAAGGFDPARTGTWRIRARTSNTDAQQSSAWSPVRSVAIS